jgi:hypothetical protein
MDEMQQLKRTLFGVVTANGLKWMKWNS